MTKFSERLLVLTLTVGLGSFAGPSYAQDDASQDAGQPAASSGGDTEASSDGDAKKDETFLEKLEEDFKETTTPTDEETDPIGTNEDADRDLY